MEYLSMLAFRSEHHDRDQFIGDVKTIAMGSIVWAMYYLALKQFPLEKFITFHKPTTHD